jgi:3D (Asp-Asp-Asp) domain-containing protein
MVCPIRFSFSTGRTRPVMFKEAKMKPQNIVLAVVALCVVIGVTVAGSVMVAGVFAGQESRQGTEPSSSLVSLKVELESTRDELSRALSVLGDVFGHEVKPDELQSVPVTITAYSSSIDQCDSTPYIAANNEPVRVGVLAVSPDMKKELGIRFGQRVLLPGYGLFEVCDVMNPRWKRRVDIWESDRQAARLFGKRQGVMIWAPMPAQGAAPIKVADNS